MPENLRGGIFLTHTVCVCGWLFAKYQKKSYERKDFDDIFQEECPRAWAKSIGEDADSVDPRDHFP